MTFVAVSVRLKLYRSVIKWRKLPRVQLTSKFLQVSQRSHRMGNVVKVTEQERRTSRSMQVYEEDGEER